jgi:hypothetical protein
MRNSLGPSRVPRTVLTLLLPVVAAGCLPSLNDPDRGPLTQTFAVSDYFSPSGFMGDGAFEGYVTMEVNQNCLPRPTNAHGSCYHFTYYMDPNSGPLYWAGVYWVFPSNSWGTRPGYKIDPTVFKQVRFYAAVKTPAVNTTKGGGTSFFNGIAGGISLGKYTACTQAQEDAQVVATDTSPNGDKTNCEYDDEYRGETNLAIGTDITDTPKPFSLVPMDQGKGYVPDDLVGAFAWSMDFPSDSCTCSVTVTTVSDCRSTTDPSSPTGMGVLNCPYPVEVWLDDVVWDTTPPPAAPDAGAAPSDASGSSDASAAQ